MASGWQGEGWHMEVGVLLLLASLITGTVKAGAVVVSSINCMVVLLVTDTSSGLS